MIPKFELPVFFSNFIPKEVLLTEYRKNKYFGTDGFRGEANVTLTSMHAYRIGRFLGWYYASALYGRTDENYRPKVVIGKDTRRSSYMLEYSIAAGLAASGADAYMLHVTTTPSVSYVTKRDDFDCGIMITASHNPYFDNGIKIINRNGEKMDDETLSLIESYLDGNLRALGTKAEDLPLKQREEIGRIVDNSAGRNRYIAYLIALASHSYKHLRIGLDLANGASHLIAQAVFGALGAQVEAVGTEPNGVNINLECGSTHTERLCRLVKEKQLDIGFAFDGDGDRCIAVDENGNTVDGDRILYILAKRFRDRGMLENNTVAATVMSNSGLFETLEREGIHCAQTSVGDRFVYECMLENGYALGGEQSGHIIMKKYATTGDGILTALMLTEEICDRKCSLSRLSSSFLIYPQYVENLKVTDKEAALSDFSVCEAVRKTEALIGGKGRILLRKSGTESVIRILVECESGEKCKEYARGIARVIRESGYCHE